MRMTIRAGLALAAVSLAANAAPRPAEAVGVNIAAFRQAAQELFKTTYLQPERPDYREVRQLVIQHPGICEMISTQGDGVYNDRTLLEFAISDDFCRRDPQADQTLRLILAHTNYLGLYAVNPEHKCALDYACGCPELMDLLYAKYRAQRKMPNMNQVLLNWISSSSSPSLVVVRWLMARGANPRSQDDQGYTIIQRAEEERLPGVVEALEGQ